MSEYCNHFQAYLRFLPLKTVHRCASILFSPFLMSLLFNILLIYQRHPRFERPLGVVWYAVLYCNVLGCIVLDWIV
uniref:Uncharacterized protein n=1 Tax=Cannabis sativa TaxID=3483 RepID=A0A803RBG6_CANSA